MFIDCLESRHWSTVAGFFRTGNIFWPVSVGWLRRQHAGGVASAQVQAKT
jgi:hypothetical protein